MPDRESRKKQITAMRREQILKAALEVFARKGFDAATIPEIARMAGVAAGTIYIYYPGKRDLFIAVIENLVVTPLSQILINDSRPDFNANIKDALQDRVGIMQSEILPRFLSLMGEIQRDPELRKFFTDRLIRPFMTRMEGLYRDQLLQGLTMSIDTDLLVRFVASVIIGLTMLKGLEGDASPLNRFSQEEAAEKIQRFIFYGVSGLSDLKKEHSDG